MNTVSENKISMKGIGETQFQFEGQTNFYRGKVRDVYSIGQDLLVMVASDRISAFDHVLPRPIPYKGQVLNAIASKFLSQTRHICPNWVLDVPDPNVTVGKRCEPFKIEMVIRGYLAGHSWRVYKSGERVICGVQMPDGMKESDAFPEPIITPATKADEGHDEDISREDIIAQGLATEEQLTLMEKYTRELYAFGQEHANKQGLILVDTKYEFGIIDGEITLMDEIHTPDSSRYYYLEGYAERQTAGERQKQLSKEFVREWLMENDFQGLEGQKMPDLPDEFVNLVTDRYVELYEKLTGEHFDRVEDADPEGRIKDNVAASLAALMKVQ